jgi:hypothetical protein
MLNYSRNKRNKRMFGWGLSASLLEIHVAGDTNGSKISH